ncbi:hypothetical protein B0O80DRAFT_431863 [Mortierella sp. GBAus27b]|nr:hypothetical protein B0O80DRAFT_431863 [Mortierella sp. GBAus27b]
MYDNPSPELAQRHILYLYLDRTSVPEVLRSIAVLVRSRDFSRCAFGGTPWLERSGAASQEVLLLRLSLRKPSGGKAVAAMQPPDNDANTDSSQYHLEGPQSDKTKLGDPRADDVPCSKASLRCLSSRKVLELVNFYLENARNAVDPDIALVMCHEAAALLSQAKRHSDNQAEHPDNQAVIEGIAMAYADLGKQLESRGNDSEAQAMYKNAEDLG